MCILFYVYKLDVTWAGKPSREVPCRLPAGTVVGVHGAGRAGGMCLLLFTFSPIGTICAEEALSILRVCMKV